MASDAEPASSTGPIRRLLASGRRTVDRIRPGGANGPPAESTDEDEVSATTDSARALGVRTARRSGGSVVVTIPPDVVDRGPIDVGDDVIVATDGSVVAMTDRDRYLGADHAGA